MYKENIAILCDTLAHRGPDAKGHVSFEKCLLGHRRLSIIDVEGGIQPFLVSNESIATVFNGELYGYTEIKKNISGKFYSKSDTELIPNLYKLYGDSFVKHLPGMFAFGLWDNNLELLICGRDRLGEKPLYYEITEDGSFLFASEIKAIVKSRLVKLELNREALASFLTLRYIPEGLTIYKEIHTLPPGHQLCWRDGRLDIKSYWRLPESNTNPPRIEDASEELQYLLKKSVQKSLVADVEVGLLLSGGLDSSTLAAIATNEQKIRSFAFGFEGERDERPYARSVAEMYGLDHHELSDGLLDLPAMLEMMPFVYDEPFGDTSAIPTYLLCEKVSKYVKVALSGDGGDELLAGYDYWYNPLVDLSNSNIDLNSQANILNRHWQDVKHFSDQEIIDFGLIPMSRPQLRRSYGSVDDAMRMDLVTFLPADILKKTDRAAMANGLELRAPFLDVDVVEFLVSLPWQYKTNGVDSKILLRNAYSRMWPDSIRSRTKQGFGTRVKDWMMRPDMLMMREFYLKGRNRKIRTLFSDSMIDRYAEATGQRGWLLLVLAIWLERSEWVIS